MASRALPTAASVRADAERLGLHYLRGEFFDGACGCPLAIDLIAHGDVTRADAERLGRDGWEMRAAAVWGMPTAIGFIDGFDGRAKVHPSDRGPDELDAYRAAYTHGRRVAKELGLA